MCWAARLSGAAAAVCLALAAVEYFRPAPEPEPAWSVTPTAHDLGDVPLGEHVIAFELTNPAARPRRVIGLNEGCQPAVCLRSRHPDPITVPAGGTFRYECVVHVRAAEPFALAITIFLEDDGIRTVTLAARGTGVATGSEPSE